MGFAGRGRELTLKADPIRPTRVTRRALSRLMSPCRRLWESGVPRGPRFRPGLGGHFFVGWSG